jgi:tRNA 2-thiouridine synthesizing protein A
MELTTPFPHRTIDLSGLRCPHLVIATIEALRTLELGQVLQVITTDINSPSNMAAWCRQSGNRMLDMYDEEDRFVFYLQRQEETVVPDDSSHIRERR